MLQNSDSGGPLVIYHYKDAAPTWPSEYLWPAVKRILAAETLSGRRAFDLGCGNGATANMLLGLGFDVLGVDPSETGITLARQSYSGCRFEIGSSRNDLAAAYGRFSLVVSLEVVAHCHAPREFADRVYDLLEPGGLAIISAPYHGYLKNLALAFTGRFDDHFNTLWDGGFVKFFSIRTLQQLLSQSRFRDIYFMRVGRIPALAKSMIAVVRK